LKISLDILPGILIDGKFKFMSLDNTLAATKRISQEADTEALISENLRMQISGKAKIKKLEGKKLWKIEKIIDRSQHQDYVRKFKTKHDKK